MKLFIVSIAVPEGYRGSRSELAQQIRGSISQLDAMDDEQLLTGLVDAPEGDGDVGVLVYRRLDD